MGQNGNREHLKQAQQYFHLVGSSPSECDTIPGRQCMASYLFIQHQFDQVCTREGKADKSLAGYLT